MANLVPLKIITPQGIFWDKEVDIVTVKTTEGYIGLQKGKSPFVASLDIAELLINSNASSKKRVCAIAGGLVIAKQESIDIITDAIEFKDDIDVSRAQRAKTNAEAALKQSKSDEEQQQAQIALKKAINRIQVKKQ